MPEQDDKQPACDHCLDQRSASGIPCGCRLRLTIRSADLASERASNLADYARSFAAHARGERVMGLEDSRAQRSRTATRPRVLGPARVVVGVAMSERTQRSLRKSLAADALEFSARALEQTGESGTADAVVLLRQLADQERAS